MADAKDMNDHITGLRQRHAELTRSIKRLREGAVRPGFSSSSNPQHLDIMSFEAALIGSQIRALQAGAKTRR